MIDRQFVVKHQHLQGLALKRTDIEVEIPNLLGLQISHIEKFLGKSLVQPSLCGSLSHCENELSQKCIELNLGSQIFFKGHGDNLLVTKYVSSPVFWKLSVYCALMIAGIGDSVVNYLFKITTMVDFPR